MDKPVAHTGGSEMAGLVREERLELSRIAPLDPKSSAYANFATLARKSTLQGKEFNIALPCRQERNSLPVLENPVFRCVGRGMAGFARRAAGAFCFAEALRGVRASAGVRAFVPPYAA